MLDINKYYPFGMNFINNGAVFDPVTVPYNYKYNGKELQETGMYDYGWRQYMPDIARWNGMDQLAESYNSYSPYAYVMNNPVMFTDPDGRYSSGGGGNWWDNVWKAAGENGTTIFSNFDSDGNWGSSKFTPFAELGTATAFYNFLAGGGTGMYGYWTGTSSTSGYYYKSDPTVMYGSSDLGILHWINIKGKSDSFLDNIFSSTTTISETNERDLLPDFGFGDRIYFADSASKTFGKSKIINLDVAINNRRFDGFSISTKLGTSFSLKADGTKEIGQMIGKYEFHAGIGPGIGLGQYNVGYKTTTDKNESVGHDIVSRPGYGTALFVGLTVATIVAPEATIPVVARILSH